MAERDDIDIDERRQFSMGADQARDAVSERPILTPDAAAPGVPVVVPAPRRFALRPDQKFLLRAAASIRDAVTLEWDRGTAFLFVPILMATGALAYFSLPFEPRLVPLLTSVGALALLAFLVRGRLIAHIAIVAALCVAIGALAGKVETWRAGTKMLGGEISTRLTGRIEVIEHLASGRKRLTLEVLGTERPVLKYAPERVRVSARTLPAGIRAGDVVAGLVRLRPPSGPLRPGGYDFSFESYFDRIGANGFFLKDPERVAFARSPPLGSAIFARVENMRDALATRIESHIDGEAEGEIAAALVAGVRAGIPEAVNETLRVTGLAHVLSISGLHMALVAGTIMLLLRGGFAFFPDLASRRPVKKYASGLALVALAVYLFVSGSAVAAERSFLMIAVMLVALLFDRSALTMRNLAISAIFILALSPHEVAGPSFQMSFAATAALIGAYAAWTQRRRVSRGIPASDRGIVRKTGSLGFKYFGGLAATSLLAGTATAIYGAYHFHRVSTLGLAANLVAMPVVSVLVMPFAVIGMLLMPFGLEGPFFYVMGEGLSIMIAVSDWFAARSQVGAVGMIPVSAVAFLTIALVLATLLTTRLRLTAVPFALFGLVMIATRPLPDLLIAEDGRLLAIRQGDDIAVNRARPSTFTASNWRLAMGADVIMKPVLQDNPMADDAQARQGFTCSDELCMGRSDTGKIIVHARAADAAWPFCGKVALIVIDDATAGAACATTSTKIVTKKDLARQGAAAVTFPASGLPDITFSIETDYRPWHEHRQFSREARGLAPYVWRPLPGKTNPATDPGGGIPAADSPFAGKPPDEVTTEGPADDSP